MLRLKNVFYAGLLVGSYLNAYELDEVKISSSPLNTDSKLRNVIVITEQELQNKAYVSLEQALERVSVINFVNNGLGPNVDMRGQGRKANVSVKVMVDGRAINMLDSSHGFTPLKSINIEDVERIEIIPGGGAVIYGGGTRGGVIHIITKKQKKEKFKLYSGGTAFDSRGLGGNLGVDLSHAFTPHFSMSFNANQFYNGSYREGASERGFFINSKSYIDIDDRNALTIGYDYFESKDASSGYLTKEQIESNPSQKGPDDIIKKTLRPTISLDFRHQFNPELEFIFQGFYQNQKITYPKNRSLSRNTLVYRDGSYFKDSLGSLALKTRYDYKDNSYLTLAYEFSTHDYVGSGKTFYSAPPTVQYHSMQSLTDANKQSHSFFILGSHEFNEKFSLTLGTRYERSFYDIRRNYTSKMSMSTPPAPPRNMNTSSDFRTKKDLGHFALELTPSFKYSNTGLVYIKYERGFVSPSPAQFIGRNDTRTNPRLEPYYTTELDPEIFNTYELGISDFWGNFFDFNLAVFMTQSKDEIVMFGSPHSASGWWRYRNIDETRRLGAELNFSQNFEKFSFKQGLSYVDARIRKGVNKGLSIPYVPKIKASLGVEYAPNNSFLTFIDLNYISRAKDAGNVDVNDGTMRQNQWIKPYALVDLGGVYRYKNLQVFAGIRNLFNKTYFTYQDSFGDRYLLGDGRSYYVKFEYAF